MSPDVRSGAGAAASSGVGAAGWGDLAARSPPRERACAAPDAKSVPHCRRRRTGYGSPRASQGQRRGRVEPRAPGATRLAGRRHSSEGAAAAAVPFDFTRSSFRGLKAPRSARGSPRDGGRAPPPSRGGLGGSGEEGEARALIRAAKTLKAALGRSTEGPAAGPKRGPARTAASARRASGAEARLLRARRQAHRHLIRRSKALLDRWERRERRREALAAEAGAAPPVVHRLLAGRGGGRAPRSQSGTEDAAAALRAMQDLVEGRIRRPGRAAGGRGERARSAPGRHWQEEGRGGESNRASVRHAWPPAPAPTDVHVEHRYDPGPRRLWRERDGDSGAVPRAPPALAPATMAHSARSSTDAVAKDNWAQLDAYLGAE